MLRELTAQLSGSTFAMPRFRLPRPIAAATLVLGALAVPQVAAAQSLPQLVQCAVGYSAGPEMVVLTAGTVERQALINDAGAACTATSASSPR